MAMARADEWSEDLSRALLAVPFNLRNNHNDQDGTTEQLLIKVIAHAPSQTMAIVVVPLASLVVLYEGLSLRTMQRRSKFSPPLSLEVQSQLGDSLPSLSSSLSSSSANAINASTFDTLAAWICGSITGSAPVAGSLRIWNDNNIGRSEATIDFHLETTSAPTTQKVVTSFDLSALDRDEGPAFLRDHLLAPALGLAVEGIQARGQQGHEPQHRWPTQLIANHLFGEPYRGDPFAAYARAIAGMSDGEAARARGPPAAQRATATAATAASPPLATQPSSPDGRRSRTRSVTQSESPEPRANKELSPPQPSLSLSPRPSAQWATGTPPDLESPPRVAAAVVPARPQVQRISEPAYAANNLDDEDDEEMLAPRPPTSQQPRLPSTSPAARATPPPPPAQPSSMPSSTQTTPAKDGTKERATAGPRTGGRGASSYRRGLAKRQRI